MLSFKLSVKSLSDCGFKKPSTVKFWLPGGKIAILWLPRRLRCKVFPNYLLKVSEAIFLLTIFMCSKDNTFSLVDVNFGAAVIKIGDIN